MAAASTRVRLRVSPGAGRAQVVGRHGDAWKVRVTAAPEQGRANDAVLRLLAEVLAVPRDSARARFGARGPGQDRRADRPRAGARRAPPRIRVGARSRQEGPARMSIDTDAIPQTLLEERAARRAGDRQPARGPPGSIDDEVEEISGASDNHLAETATATLDREIDYTLEENSGQVLTEIDAALARIEDGTYGTCAAAASRSARRGSRRIRGRRSASTDARQAERGERALDRPAAPARSDVRVGSIARTALSPVSVAERSLAARRGAVAQPRRNRARRGRRRPADEARRHEPARARRAGARRRPVLDPPRPELGHRLRALLQRDRRGDRAHRRSRSRGCSCFFARSGARHPCCRLRSGW